jgi:DNA polymerase elongation subunit (family B)
LFYEEDYKIIDTYNVENIDLTYCIYRDKRDIAEKQADREVSELLFPGGKDLLDVMAVFGKPVVDAV